MIQSCLRFSFPALCGLVMLVSHAAASSIESTFDADLEGWTTSVGGDLAFVSTGGNGGGFLQQTDLDLSDMFVSAPAKFLGDLSSFLNGTLSFDARQVSGNGEKYAPFGFVTIFNGGNAISADIAGPEAPSIDWTTFTVTLDAASFGTTPAAVADVLSNVTMMMVQLESQIGVVEVTGMDNFRLTSAVPEPSMLLIGGFGVCGALLIRRQRA